MNDKKEHCFVCGEFCIHDEYLPIPPFKKFCIKGVNDYERTLEAMRAIREIGVVCDTSRDTFIVTIEKIDE